MKLQKVAVVSKVGSKESEDAAKNVAKKFLAKKSMVFTISPIEVEGAKKVETFPSKILKCYACLDCLDKAIKQRDLELQSLLTLETRGNQD